MSAGSQKGEITCAFLSLSCLNITKNLQIKEKCLILIFQISFLFVG